VRKFIEIVVVFSILCPLIVIAKLYNLYLDIKYYKKVVD